MRLVGISIGVTIDALVGIFCSFLGHLWHLAAKWAGTEPLYVPLKNG